MKIWNKFGNVVRIYITNGPKQHSIIGIDNYHNRIRWKTNENRQS